MSIFKTVFVAGGRIALKASSALIGRVHLRNPGDTANMGDASNPVRVDPTGSTTQPISATALPLPTGAATESTLATRAADRTNANAPFSNRLSDGSNFYNAAKTEQLPSTLAGGKLDTNVGTWLGSAAPTIGQKAASSSIPVVLPTDQSSIPTKSEVQLDYDTGAGVQQLSVIGIGLPANGGVVAGGTDTNPIKTGNASGSQVDGHSATLGSTGDADTANSVIGRLKKVVSLLAGGLPPALIGNRLDIHLGSWLGSSVPTVGQKTMAQSIPVTIASNQSTGSTKIEDGGGSGRLAYVDGANRLLVTANATVVPPASVAVEQSAISDLTGTSDLVYVIPSGKTLTITRFAGGAEGNSGKVSRVDLYYDPLGTGVGMTLIRSMYLSGTNWEYGLDYKATGDGTISIRMRRERLDGAADEVAGFWSGYRDV